MGCRCNERRAALQEGAASLKQGDAQGVASSVSFVARTASEDAMQALRNRLTSAKQNLQAMRRRS
jgi:hypothetical protein